MLFSRIKEKTIFWVEVILCLVFIILIPLMFIARPIWLSTSLGSSITNFGHLIFFGILTFLSYRKLNFRESLKTILIFLSVLFLGLAIEFVQSLVGRDASWADIARNLIGAGFILTWLSRANYIAWAGRLFFTGLIGIQIFFLWSVVIEHYRIHKLFPVISNLESKIDFDRWRGSVRRVNSFSSDGKFSMEVKFRANEYSRINLYDVPLDWSHSSRLCFDIYNPENTDFQLTIRINDAEYESGYGDRFNRSLEVQSHWNNYCIPLEDVKKGPESRELNLQEIKRISLYAARLPMDHTIFTDNWRLE